MVIKMNERDNLTEEDIEEDTWEEIVDALASLRLFPWLKDENRK